MYSKDYDESFAHGLLHTGGWADGSIEREIDYLNNNKGSRNGCLRNLQSNTEAIATIKFFREKNLIDMKQWAFVSAKLRIMLQHEINEGVGIENMLWPLLSDNEELMQWYCADSLFYDSLENPESKYQVNTNEFAKYQFWRILTKRWSELSEDCERALAHPDEFNKKLRPRLEIFKYYLALAQGDTKTMQDYLLKECAPRQRSRSYLYESGLTRDFIVSYATIYAKLAWRSGYELDLDTPWIPKDWLPVNPLPVYEDPWPFMQNFDIWQPLKGDWAKWSPKRPASEP